MSRKAKQRRHLFEVFAANLRLYFPWTGGNIVLCPLCRRAFDRDALAPPPKLTLAHVVPRSLGGAQCVLTCADCNSTMGTKFDASVARARSAQRFFEGHQKYPIVMRSTNGEGMLRAEATLRAGRWQIRAVERKSHPKLVDKLVEEMTGNWPGYQFSISLETPNLRRVLFGHYHAAFLAAFGQYGYEYALSFGGKTAAGILLSDPEAFPVERYVLPEFNEVGQSTTTRPIVGVMHRPREYKSLLVQLPPLAATEKNRGVLLPGLRHLDMLTYAALARLDEPFGRYECTGHDPAPRLVAETSKGCLHRLWDVL